MLLLSQPSARLPEGSFYMVGDLEEARQKETQSKA